MKPISITQAAYIAGITDGEGNISLHRKQKKSHHNYTYSCDVSVTNTKIQLLSWLKQVTGLGIIAPAPTNPRWKPRWKWSLHIEEIPCFLQAILPYLVIKAEHASLMLEFCEFNKYHGPNHPISEEDIIRKMVIFDELAELNVRGL